MMQILPVVMVEDKLSEFKLIYLIINKTLFYLIINKYIYL